MKRKFKNVNHNPTTSQLHIALYLTLSKCSFCIRVRMNRADDTSPDCRPKSEETGVFSFFRCSTISHNSIGLNWWRACHSTYYFQRHELWWRVHRQRDLLAIPSLHVEPEERMSQRMINKMNLVSTAAHYLLTSSEISSYDWLRSTCTETGVAAAISSLQTRSTVSMWSWVTTAFGFSSM